MRFSLSTLDSWYLVMSFVLLAISAPLFMKNLLKNKEAAWHVWLGFLVLSGAGIAFFGRQAPLSLAIKLTLVAAVIIGVAAIIKGTFMPEMTKKEEVNVEARQRYNELLAEYGTRQKGEKIDRDLKNLYIGL